MTCFPNFNFWGQQWGKRAKNGLKWQIIMSCTPYQSKHTLFYFIMVFVANGPKWQNKFISLCILGTVPHMIVVFGKHVQNDDISSNIFFHFFKSLIFGVFQSSSINVKRELWGLSHLLHTCVIFFCIFIQSFQKFHMQYYVACQLAR